MVTLPARTISFTQGVPFAVANDSNQVDSNNPDSRRLGL